MISSSRIGEVSSSFTTHKDQRIFLSAISRACPEFWDTLRDEVLPCWPGNVSIHSIRRGYRDPAFASIQPSFSAWIERFHIQTVTWLHRVALLHLRAWAEHPAAPTRLVGLASELEWGDDISFHWDPRLETLAAFVSRVEREGRSLSSGQLKCPPPLSAVHAEWLALYQLAGLSPREIQKRSLNNGTARGQDMDSSAIRHGYTAAAQRLAIPLRAQRRGRPRNK